MAWNLKLTDMGELKDPSFYILGIRDWSHQRRRKRRKRCFTYNPIPRIFLLDSVCVCVSKGALTCVQLFATVHQCPLSMEFSRQEYWRGLPFPIQGIFPIQGSNPCLLHLLRILYHCATWETLDSVLSL